MTILATLAADASRVARLLLLLHGSKVHGRTFQSNTKPDTHSLNLRKIFFSCLVALLKENIILFHFAVEMNPEFSGIFSKFPTVFLFCFEANLKIKCRTSCTHF